MEEVLRIKQVLLRCGYYVCQNRSGLFDMYFINKDEEIKEDIVVELHSLDDYTINVWNGSYWEEFPYLGKALREFGLEQKF